MGNECIKYKQYIRGCISYYYLSNMRCFLLDTDEWLECVYGSCGRNPKWEKRIWFYVESLKVKIMDGLILE